MELHYTIWDPTKNLTLLVSDPAPGPDRSGLAVKLMERFPHVEQVGFLEPASLPGAALRLQMMGGEFCGNASMSAAAFLAQRRPARASAAVWPLEVSGYPGLLSCRLSPAPDGGWTGTVDMPLPERVGHAEVPSVGRVPAVVFAGITHCIVPAGALTRSQAEAAIRPLCAGLGADACGILLYDEAASAFAPLVYVASTDTAVWESGCGSGSAALGSWLAARDRTDCTADLRQPGGVITVTAAWAGKVAALSITGTVRLLERGSVVI